MLSLASSSLRALFPPGVLEFELLGLRLFGPLKTGEASGLVLTVVGLTSGSAWGADIS